MIRNPAKYPQHNAAVVGGYRPYARCGCGWVGPARNDFPWAQADAEQHNQNANTGPFRPTFRHKGFLG